MKQVHGQPVSTAASPIAVLVPFEIIDGTPPGPADPGIGEILVLPGELCTRDREASISVLCAAC